MDYNQKDIIVYYLNNDGTQIYDDNYHFKVVR